MFHTIIVPTRPQPDTLVAIYLIKRYGVEKLPGIENAKIITDNSIPEFQEEFFEKQGIILFDIGKGRFDHHQKEPVTTCSQLVADFLNISHDPSIKKLLDYAYRDDTLGKGTISTDSLDRAFGLSGLIAALNKKYPEKTQLVSNFILPLIEAHHDEELRRFEEFPQEISLLEKSGKITFLEVKQHGNKIKIVFLESNTVGLAGYLRSQLGGKYDIVVQKLNSNHINVITKPTKRPDLRKLTALIRSTEYEKKNNLILLLPEKELQRNGKIDEVPNWYFDPATNSLQNGGSNPQNTEPTMIPWDEFKEICKEGLSIEKTIFN